MEVTTISITAVNGSNKRPMSTFKPGILSQRVENSNTVPPSWAKTARATGIDKTNDVIMAKIDKPADIPGQRCTNIKINAAAKKGNKAISQAFGKINSYICITSPFQQIKVVQVHCSALPVYGYDQG
jgi:hypothetical protein